MHDLAPTLHISIIWLHFLNGLFAWKSCAEIRTGQLTCKMHGLLNSVQWKLAGGISFMRADHRMYSVQSSVIIQYVLWLKCLHFLLKPSFSSHQNYLKCYWGSEDETLGSTRWKWNIFNVWSVSKNLLPWIMCLFQLAKYKYRIATKKKNHLKLKLSSEHNLALCDILIWRDIFLIFLNV